MLNQTCLTKIPSLFVGYQRTGVVDGNDNDNDNTETNSMGGMLIDCVHHPHALTVIAKESGAVISNDSSSSNNNNNNNAIDNHLDSCVWLARLITKYTESVQRIRTPPGITI